VLAALFATGCPTVPATGAALDGAVGLDLGTGETSFVSLVDGGTIELVMGPQGGWHVWASTRIIGVDPNGRIIHYVAETTDGVVLAEASLALMTRFLTPIDGGWLRLGDRVIFPITGPADVVGRTIVLRVTLEDPAILDSGASDGGVARHAIASAMHVVTIVDDVP
jgi:hypothetical protein